MAVGKRPYFFAVVLEVDEEDKGLARVGIENAVAWYFQAWMKGGYWIRFVQNLDEGIDIEAS